MVEHNLPKAHHVAQVSGFACRILYINATLPVLEPPAHGRISQIRPQNFGCVSQARSARVALETLIVL